MNNLFCHSSEFENNPMQAAHWFNMGYLTSSETKDGNYKFWIAVPKNCFAFWQKHLQKTAPFVRNLKSY